jgi:hypothetical protein
MKTNWKILKCVVTQLLDPWYPLDRMGGFQTWSGHYGKEKKITCPCQESSPIPQQAYCLNKTAYISRVYHYTALWEQKLSGTSIAPISQFCQFTLLQ